MNNEMMTLKRRYVGVRGLDGSVDEDTGRFMLVVPAAYVGPKYLAYDCPFCPKRHRHGSGGDMFNRIESRSPHCAANRSHDVEIVVSSATPRVGQDRPPIQTSGAICPEAEKEKAAVPPKVDGSCCLI